jgi:peptidoglycan hydrolase CwlO-like protein
MRIKNVFFIVILSFLAFLVPVVTYVHAEDSEEEQTEEEIQEEIEDIQEKIEEYEKKISELQGQADTLQNEIAYMDSQIGITQLKIQNSIANIRKTEDRIEELSEGIENLGIRIDKLEKSIDYQQSILDSRMRERYKDRGNNVLMMFFGSETLSSLVKKTEYLKALEENDNKLIDQMGETKGNFETQKGIFEDKKDEQETLKAQLEAEKANLDRYKGDLENQKSAKDKLLKDTQNDEAKYQELLAKAEKELASFAEFTQYAGGGVIGSNEFGSGKEGWYLSQRDSRWANKKIGKSNYTIFEVGCLITSVAMLYNHYGYSVTPADIANDDSRFFASTALMLIPWKAPPGKSYTAISKSSIDDELEKRPVVVGVYAGPYGTHFVVLSEEDDGDYIMYDPWYGPDLKFSKYYSKSSIYSAVVFK